jgi:hypothetical protein
MRTTYGIAVAMTLCLSEAWWAGVGRAIDELIIATSAADAVPARRC